MAKKPKRDIIAMNLDLAQKNETLTRLVAMLEEELYKTRGNRPVLTRRDHLAAAALTGLLAGAVQSAGSVEAFKRYDAYADASVSFADAMLVQLKERSRYPKDGELE